MLLDSNIIIYAAQPGRNTLREWIAEQAPSVSVISYVEVLGYHKLGDDDKQALASFFAAARILPLTAEAADQAVLLRQRRRMSLGDSLIAATALAFDLTLVTHNTSDFDWIAAIRLLDPLAENE